MHIVIIPSEPYVPERFPLSGIFQKDQAQALYEQGEKVGIVSPEFHMPLSMNNFMAVFPPVLRVEQDGDLPVVRKRGFYFLPKMEKQKATLWCRAGKKAFAVYCERFGKPDVIHAHNALYAGILAQQIQKKWGIPYVITEHSSAYGLDGVPVQMFPLIAEAYQQAACRMVVSPALGKILEKKVGDSIKPWEWVPNILNEVFDDVEVDSLPVEERAVGRRFLSIGNLIEIKGHRELITAFAQQYAGKDGYELRIGGSGVLRDALEQLSSSLGVEKQVTFLGRLNRVQVLAEMQQCDIFVQPSYTETFGVALIEGLACGKPVISTRCGGPEAIVNEANGLLVEPKDVEALGQALMQLSQSLHDYDPVAIRHDCIGRFGKQAVAEQLIGIYTEVVKS